MSRLLCAVLSACVWLLVVGCASAEQGDKPLKMDVILKAGPGGFWKSVRQGAQAAAEEFSVDITFHSPSLWENEGANQAAFMERSIERGADAVVIAPNGEEGLPDLVTKATEKRIPVFTIHSKLDSAPIVSHIATDNHQAAVMAAQALIENDIRGSLAVISVPAKDSIVRARESGFAEGVKENPEIEITNVLHTSGEKKTAMRDVKKLLRENQNITGILGICEGCAVGSALAVRDLNMKQKTFVIGFGSSQDEIRLLEEGIIDALVVENPFAMGYFGVKTAVDRVRGKRVNTFVDIPTIIVTKETINLPEHQKLIYPFDER